MSKPGLLLINKFYHDYGPSGGVGRYLVQEEEDLLSAGWNVIPFGMADEHVRPSPYSDFFVKARDYSTPSFSLRAVGDAVSLIWNREAARKLDALIRKTRPQVAHIHNIYHHLSPSILPILKHHNIPVVMTLHDLRLLCPAIHMMRDNKPCEECKGGQLYNAVRYKCVKESRGASVLAAIETFNQRAQQFYENSVSRFLCPSQFIKTKYQQWGYPAEKLLHMPNFVDLDVWHPDQLPPATNQNSYLYFGRISKEKGLRTLLDAQQIWENKAISGEVSEPPLRLKIAGTGPCEENLKARVAMLNLKTVDILGPLNQAELRQALAESRFSVMPSQWYENGPMAAWESLAVGVPLVGSDIGGIPEIIRDGINGIIVPPGDAAGIFKGLLLGAALPPEAKVAARKWAEEKASRVKHMAKLNKILQDLI